MPGNFSNNPVDAVAAHLANGFVGTHLEVGVPVLDRDLNLLFDLAVGHCRELLARYIGDGVAVGADAFRIQSLGDPSDIPPPDPNDFAIGGGVVGEIGHYLVQGLQVSIDSGSAGNYSAQMEPDGSPIAALTTPVSPPRVDIVYIDAWLEEVDQDVDPNIDLGNDQDVGVRTSVRLRLRWLVRVREGLTALPQPGDADHTQGHFYAEVAELTRVGGPILANEIRDTRSTKMRLSDFQERMTAFENNLALLFPQEQIARGNLLLEGFEATDEADEVAIDDGVAFVNGRFYRFPATEITLPDRSITRFILAQVVNGQASLVLEDAYRVARRIPRYGLTPFLRPQFNPFANVPGYNLGPLLNPSFGSNSFFGQSFSPVASTSPVSPVSTSSGSSFLGQSFSPVSSVSSVSAVSGSSFFGQSFSPLSSVSSVSGSSLLGQSFSPVSSVSAFGGSSFVGQSFSPVSSSVSAVSANPFLVQEINPLTGIPTFGFEPFRGRVFNREPAIVRPITGPPRIGGNQILLYAITPETSEEQSELVDYRVYGRMEADEARFSENLEAGYEEPLNDVVFRIGYPEDVGSMADRRDAPPEMRLGPQTQPVMRYTRAGGVHANIDEWKLKSNKSLPDQLVEYPQVLRYVIAGAELAVVKDSANPWWGGDLRMSSGSEAVCTLNHLPHGARIVSLWVTGSASGGSATVWLRRRDRSDGSYRVIDSVTVYNSSRSTLRKVLRADDLELVDEESYLTIEVHATTSSQTSVNIFNIGVDYAVDKAWPSYPYEAPA